MSQPILNFLKYPAVFCAAGALCFVALAVLGKCAAFCGLIDRPRERHIHRAQIPLIGGMAVYAAFFGACALIFWGPWGGLPGRLDAAWCRRFFVIASLFVGLGVVDDRFELKPRWKLAGQILAAVVAYLLDVRFGRLLGLPVPAGVDLAATVVWFVAFVNAFNLIDGMDGVATGVAITGGVGLMILFGLERQPVSVLVLLAMLGACSVFLRYNFHPAKYFLGDAGSLLLGAFFSTVALSSNTKSMTVASLGFPLLVVGVPLMDSVLAIWRRVIRKILGRFGDAGGAAGSAQVMGGDLEHLHHRLAGRGYSQRKVAYILYGLNTFLVGIGLVIIVRNSLAVGLAFVSFIILVYVVVNHLATLELSLSGDAFIAGLHRPGGRGLAMVLYPLYDCAALVWGSLIALVLAGPVLRAGLPLRLLWLHSAPLLVSMPLGALFLFGAYRRMWSRARVSEYAFLFFALAGGGVAGVGLLAMLRGWSLYQAVLLSVLLLFCDASLIVGARAFPRVAMDLAGWGHRRRFRAGMRRALIYGAGYQSTLLLREMTFKRPCRQNEFHLQGLIDDNPAMWGRVIHGYAVLGGVDVLCERMERGAVDEVTLACELPPDPLRRVLDVAKAAGVRVERWSCIRQPVV